MNKKPLVVIVLVSALLALMLFSVQPVSSQSSYSQTKVNISADGSVTGTNKIHQSGNTYTLTGNLNASITIEKDNIIFNGAGYTLQGSGNLTGNETAVSLTNRTDDVIENLNITGFNTAIALINSSKCIISGNKIYGNNSNGISLTNSWDDWVKQNYLDQTQNSGITLNNSNSSTVSENNIINGAGISVNNRGANSNNIISRNLLSNNSGIGIDSSNNIIIGNNMTSSGISTVVNGLGTSDPSNNIFTENYISNSAPAAFFVGNNNTFFKNNFFNNSAAVGCLGTAKDDVFYDNNFINNTLIDVQVALDSTPSSPSWDNGTVGNYWSDYLTKYPAAEEVNNTGTYNTPYTIVENTSYIHHATYYFYDNHPLVNPVEIVQNVTEVPSWVTPSPSQLNQGLPSSYIGVAIVILAIGIISLLLYRRHQKTANLKETTE